MKKILLGVWLGLYAAFTFAGVNIPSYGGRPYFSAYLNTPQGVVNNTNTVVKLDTVLEDSGSYFNSGNWQYTPKVAGLYWVNGCITGNQTATSGTQAYGTYLNKNTVAFAQQTFSEANATFNLNAQECVSGLVRLNGSTDYITLSVLIIGLGPSINTGQAVTNLQVFYLGP